MKIPIHLNNLKIIFSFEGVKNKFDIGNAFDNSILNVDIQLFYRNTVLNISPTITVNDIKLIYDGLLNNNLLFTDIDECLTLQILDYTIKIKYNYLNFLVNISDTWDYTILKSDLDELLNFYYFLSN